MIDLLRKNIDRLLIAIGALLLIYNYNIESATCNKAMTIEQRLSGVYSSFSCPSETINFIAGAIIIIGILMILSRTKKFGWIGKIIRR